MSKMMSASSCAECGVDQVQLMGLAALRRSRALHQQVPPSQLQSRRLRQQSGCRNISTEALTSYRQGSVQDISSRGKRRASGTASKCACKLELAIRDIQRFPGKVPQGTRGLQELAAFLALDLSEDQLSQLAQSTDTALDRAQGRAVQWLRDNLDIDLEGIGMDILLIVAQLTFSLWYVIGKDALTDGVDPLTFAMVREALASVMLWVVALTFEGPFRLQKPGDARRFGLLVSSPHSPLSTPA